MGHIVNGEVGSVEGLGKRVLENGGGSESGRRFSENGGHGVPQLKYKKRKFSAVRDFPPGCGPVLVNGNSKENGVVLAPPVEDAALELKGNGSVGLELKESGAPVAALESKENGFVAHTAEDAGLESKEKIDSSVHETKTTEGLIQAEAPEPVSNSDPMGIDTSPVKLQDDLVSDHVPSSVSVDPVAVEESTKKSVYPPRRKISAMRDFPPGCGVDAASVNVEVLQNSVDSSKDKNLVKEMSSENAKKKQTDKDVLRDFPLGCVASVNIKELQKSVDSSKDKNLAKEKSSDNAKKKQIDKAVVKRGEEKVRDGDALNCKSKVTKESGDGVKRKLERDGDALKSKPKETKETGDRVKGKLEGGVKKELVEQKPSSSKKPDMGSGSSAGKVGTESVKLGKDMNYKRKFPEKSINDSRPINQSQGEESDSLDSLDDRVVVQSLMAKQNCQWSQGKNIKPATRTPSTAEQGKKTFKSARGTPSQGEQGKKTFKSPSGTPSQQVEQGRKTLKSESGNQSQVADGLGSESLEDREIVQSLMAARTCPWRNGKKVFKSLSGSVKKQAR